MINMTIIIMNEINILNNIRVIKADPATFVQTKAMGFSSDGHRVSGCRCSWSADSTIWEPGINGCRWASVLILALT